MATMTILQAERLLDRVSHVLTSQQPLSERDLFTALDGHTILDVTNALKLRVATERLNLASRQDFEQQFAEGLRLYDGIPLSLIHILIRGGAPPIDPKTYMLADSRLASAETASNFGEFCRQLGATNPAYWKRVYERLGLDHAPACPSGCEHPVVDYPEPRLQGASSLPYTLSNPLIAWIGYATAVALLVALAPLPYDYYRLLRVGVTAAAAVIATHGFRSHRLGWAWLMVLLGLLFNPITPVSLGRQLWIVVDALSAVAFFAASYSVRSGRRRVA